MRVGDLGNVIDGVENDKAAAWYNDERSISLAIFKQPGTNTVEVAEAVRKLLPTFEKQLPAAASLHILYDRSTSIRDSVSDVRFTLLLTLVLVVLVIFLFLRKLSATVIPSLALPFSIVGTFAVMYVMGYTIDNLSLMALTLSVGFVVDDAIVMLENIVRHIERGEGVFEAALKGSKEIGFTILSMTISLAAVFIPIMFMGGIIGRLFREFAVVIGVAILVSGFVSLSLTPMLCSRFLKPHETNEKHGKLYDWSERGFDLMLGLYVRTLGPALRHRRKVLAFSALILVATGWLFYKIPKGFLPTEDQGLIFGSTEGAQGIGFPKMREKQQQVAAIIRAHPAVANLLSSAGPRGSNAVGNAGIVLAQLKPRKERKQSADEIIEELRPKLAKVPGIRVFMQVPPPIRLGGSPTKSQYQYTLQDADTAELYKYAPILQEKVRALPQVQDVTSDMQLSNPQLNVSIDRDRAAALGISTQKIEDALYTAYGTRQVSTIYAPNNQYQVIMELAPQFQANPSAIAHALRALGGRRAGPALLARLDLAGNGAAHGRSPGAAPGGLDLVQPEARRGAGRRRGGGQPGRPTDVAGDRPDQLPGHRAGVPELRAGAGPAAGRGDRRDLHGARDSLRELHPPAHDPHGAAVRRLRRAGDADALPHGALHLRLRRHHHARRPGQEERHHDGRLRDRGGGEGRQAAPTRRSTRPASCGSARS